MKKLKKIRKETKMELVKLNNKKRIESLKILYELLIVYKSVFSNRGCLGICEFIKILRTENIIQYKIYLRLKRLIIFISNKSGIERKFWFGWGNYTLRKRYLEKLIKFNN